MSYFQSAKRLIKNTTFQSLKQTMNMGGGTSARLAALQQE